MDFRCAACEQATGTTRPGNCTQIVKVACVGPKIPKELAEARARVVELEKTMARMEAERASSVRQTMDRVDYCQSCGLRIRGGICEGC